MPSLPTVGIVMPLASQRGGAETLFQSLLRSRPQDIHFVCCFLEQGPLVEEARSLGFQVDVFPSTHLKDLANFAKTTVFLRNWMRRHNLSLVFSWMLKAHLYVVPAARGLPIKTMWFQHGLSKKHWMDFVGAWSPADAILCCSSYAKSKQDEHFPHRPSFVCHPGVAVQDGLGETMSIARRKLSLPPNAPIVGMVARLERWKGAHIFVEAARKVLAVHPEAYFFLVGGAHPQDPAYAEEIKKMTAMAGLQQRMWLVGQRRAEEIPSWHASADLIVHPAVEAEPFGMAIAEAMASGRVVVASNLGGPAEIIENQVSGALVPPGDASALAAEIMYFLEDRQLRNDMAQQAVERARLFSIDVFVTRFQFLVSSTLNT